MVKKTRIARKPHTCDDCDKIIEVKELYKFGKNYLKGEHYFQTWYSHQCLSCAAAELKRNYKHKRHLERAAARRLNCPSVKNYENISVSGWDQRIFYSPESELRCTSCNLYCEKP